MAQSLLKVLRIITPCLCGPHVIRPKCELTGTSPSAGSCFTTKKNSSQHGPIQACVVSSLRCHAHQQNLKDAAVRPKCLRNRSSGSCSILAMDRHTAMHRPWRSWRSWRVGVRIDQTLSVRCFYCALRQWRRGNIALITTLPVLDCLYAGCNLCRAEAWGERPPPLTNDTQRKPSTNGKVFQFARIIAIPVHVSQHIPLHAVEAHP